MKTFLYSLLAAVCLVGLVSCDKNGKEPVPVDGVPFVGDWVPSSDPLHLVVKSKTGTINIPMMGEMTDEQFAMMFKMMITAEVDFSVITLTVTEIDEPGLNVLLEVKDPEGSSPMKGMYEKGLLTIDPQANGSTDPEEMALTMNVRQETANDLTIFVGKDEFIRISEGVDYEAMLGELEVFEIGLDFDRAE